MLTEERLRELYAIGAKNSQTWAQFARMVEAEARKAALEDAAKVCLELHAQGRDAGACLDAIRALKEKP